MLSDFEIEIKLNFEKHLFQPLLKRKKQSKYSK